MNNAYDINGFCDGAIRMNYTWSTYPLGTRAYAVGGGYWERVERGWKWCTGATFPTPGADYIRIVLPEGTQVH